MRTAPGKTARAGDGARLSGLIAPVFYGVHAALREERFSEYWLRGGRGSGKSSLISLEILLGMLRDPGASAIVYRKVAATLRESVYEQMLWAVEKLRLGDWFRGRLSPLEIQCPATGQRILFRGADDPGKSKSIKLARGYFKYLWLEELSEFDGVEDLRTLRASVFRGAAARCVTLCSYNPPRERSSWVNGEALIPVPGRWVHESSYLDMPKHWLGGSFLNDAEGLRESNERAWRHMYLGEVTGSGGQVFDNLSLRTVGPEEIGTLGGFVNGLDFGFAADPDALVRAAYDPKRKRLWVIGEYYGVRTPIDDLAARAEALCGGEVVRCDCAEPRMIRELRARGVQAVGAKKGPGSVAHGIRWLQDLSQIVIDPARCPNAAREFSAYACRPDGRGGFLAEFPDRDNHTIDALRYALEPVIGAKVARSLDRRGLGL